MQAEMNVSHFALLVFHSSSLEFRSLPSFTMEAVGDAVGFRVNVFRIMSDIGMGKRTRNQGT